MATSQGTARTRQTFFVSTDLDYCAAPYGHIATIPVGTPCSLRQRRLLPQLLRPVKEERTSSMKSTLRPTPSIFTVREIVKLVVPRNTDKVDPAIVAMLRPYAVKA